MENYRRLKVSAKAKALAVLVYRVTAQFPREELYELTSQARRAACGVGLAIAEGCGRSSTPKDFIRFLRDSASSAQEVEFAADLAIDLGFANEKRLRRVMAAAVEIEKMLASLIRTLEIRNSL